MMDLPQLREGQNVRVFQRIVEGKRERNVPFPGKLIKVRGIGVNRTITIRQNLEGVVVEKIFPLALPTLTKIEVIEERKVYTPPPAKKAKPRVARTKKSKPTLATKKSPKK